MTVEIAVQDVEGARIAHEEGADRVELCAALMGTGGLTPSFGMIQACSHVGVPQGVQVLIRPRGGSFVFTDEEKYVQIADVRSAILAGASGVVVGGMTEDGRIDVPFTRALAEAARNEAVRCNRKVQVTYHRAFDMLDDQFRRAGYPDSNLASPACSPRVAPHASRMVWAACGSCPNTPRGASRYRPAAV